MTQAITSLQTPLGAGALTTIGGLLLTSLVMILLAEYRRRWGLADRPLLQKWLSWAGIAPIFGLAVLGGTLTTAALALVVSLQCLREYSRLTMLPVGDRRLWLALTGLAAPVALVSTSALLALPLLVLLLASLRPLLWPTADGINPWALGFFGWCYLALIPAGLVVIHRESPGGPGLLLTIGLAVALSDVGAYLVGRRFGRHQLAPRLSPAKTWEGVAGNLLGALLGVHLMAFAWPAGLTPLLAVGLAALIGLGALWGDLIESAVKRTWAVKDAGDWLPGFGGLLDRVDSLIIVVLLVALVTSPALPVLTPPSP